jgi:hypothetical protein
MTDASSKIASFPRLEAFPADVLLKILRLAHHTTNTSKQQQPPPNVPDHDSPAAYPTSGQTEREVWANPCTCGNLNPKEYYCNLDSQRCSAGKSPFQPPENAACPSGPIMFIGSADSNRLCYIAEAWRCVGESSSNIDTCLARLTLYGPRLCREFCDATEWRGDSFCDKIMRGYHNKRITSPLEKAWTERCVNLRFVGQSMLNMLGFHSVPPYIAYNPRRPIQLLFEIVIDLSSNLAYGKIAESV